jgi:4-hydroxy-3-methylbut-2-en-1-yl diphosphate reductase
VVVGGRNSNNTRKLAATAGAAGVRTVHVQGPDELEPALLRGCRSVGLTAGTSTLPSTVDAVEARLRAIAAG